MKRLLVLLFYNLSTVFALIEYHCKSGDSTDYGQYNLYGDGIRLDGKTSIKFQVKGQSDAHILLQANLFDFNHNIIEIVLGGWRNSKSVIRSQQQKDPPRAQYSESGIISSSQFRWFWISFSGGRIRVGKGQTINNSKFMEWDGLSFPVKAISISFGFGSDGYFRFECKDTISHCIKRRCTNARDTSCDECTDNKVFYKVTQGDKKCERMCSFDNHTCWPGKCQDGLTNNCHCIHGFMRVSDSCQLAKTNKPTINQCFTTVSGPNGEKSQTKAERCPMLQQFYGNFQPVKLDIQMQSDFSVNVTIPSPPYISTSSFGVTDTSVYMKRMQLDGKEIEIGSKNLVIDMSNGTNVRRTVFNKTQILLPQPNYRLANAERLCLHFESLGGGFLQAKDTRLNKLLDPLSYDKTRTINVLCYIYDNVRPQHCRENMSCNQNPLLIDKRITRSKHVLVDFAGWSDKAPVNHSSASGIDFYEVSMYEVSNGKVSHSSVFTKKIAAAQTSYTLNVTSNAPRLYCIQLAVKDVANNVGFARRFVLYDNTSVIKTRQNRSMFYVTSASKETHYTWQIHHGDICISWKDFFYNDFYLDNPLLNSIEPNANVSGIYEQTEGLLPISGTENVNGIVKFKFSWKLNNESFSNETVVPLLKQQSHCTTLVINDGDTYTLSLTAEDIVNNSLGEARIVYIDRSGPIINNIWLTKEGKEQLFVHDNKDLSKMKLSFETFDSHSGISSIEWSFGTNDAGHQLGNGKIRVNKIKEDRCPINSSRCYCPAIGECENTLYSIDLNRLVNNNTHIGDHNRNYFFTLIVYNNARLRNIEHLDILLDESPPESGVVLEGAFGEPDVDYTSDNNFIVRWHGYIDHESGIKMFIIGISNKCLNQEDILSNNKSSNATEFFKVPHTETSIRVEANFTGKVFATVLAINNALQPSKPACSDGITRDIKPATLRNIRVTHTKWSESVFCSKGRAWLFSSELNKILLPNSVVCGERCSNDTRGSETFDILPESHNVNIKTEVAEFMCQRLPLFNKKTITYLPNDHISISWDVGESLSQIKNYFVGFGKSIGEISVPSMRKYQSTNGSPFFKVHHLGVGSDEEFYIFIRVENKAKQENTISFGPMIIDETPPLYKKKPLVAVVDEMLVIRWEEDQFYDIEQTEKIDQIFFQFVQGAKAVSPLLEWRNDSSEECKRLPGDCIFYPLRKLQEKDTELGQQFAVDTFVYNKAGHFTKLQTDPFRIPSRYSPGHGVVFDIDPAETSNMIDINAHFTDKTLCARWKGFRHHENVSLDIGVGTSKANDNVHVFKHVSTDRSLYCLTSEKFMSGVRYFITIRASCSGGTTVSSSNGVLIVDSKNLIKKSDIQVGQRSVSIVKHIRFINSSFSKVCSETHLKIGSPYEITIETNDDKLILNSNDASVQSDTQQLIHQGVTVFIIVPYVEQPCLEMYGINVHKARICIVEEQKQGYVTTNHRLSVNIEKNSKISSLLPKWTIFEQTCLNHNINSSCIHLISQSNIADFRYTFQNISLLENKTYSIGVTFCSPLSCSEMIQSDLFAFESSITSSSAVNTEITVSGIDNNVIVNISLTPFIAPSGIVLYQWILAKDADGSHEISGWKTIENKRHANLSMTESIYLPIYPHSTFYCCVRAYSYAGNMKMTCSRPTIHSRGRLETNTVYDIDASASTWISILEMVHSSSLGEQTSVLHDAELDFGTRDTKVAAVVLYATQRNVTWYLMSSRRFPAFGQCEGDTECITSQSSEDGYVLFDNKDIIMNNIYFICASSEATEIYREAFIENMPDISSCSNGFILDGIPPTGGHVHVDNTGGFLNDISDISFTLEGFSDNIDASILGYVDNLQYYSYAIGSSTATVDIQNFTKTGHAQRIKTRLNSIKDGTAVVVFCKATDWAGLSTTVHSKELVVDTSPPTTGYIVTEQVQNDHIFVSSVYIDLYLTEFSDLESGICFFELCLGTQPSTCDVTNMASFVNEYIQLQLPRNLSDGSLTFISLRAVNRAGLKSEMSTIQFIRDTSSPIGGKVMDGDWVHQNDQDFQKDLHVIAGHWLGFSDPHSGMQHYRVGLGTKPYSDDVESMVEVGLQTEITWKGTFNTGQKYYITVDACNSAGLCTSRSSDGILLDTSPPVTGVVKIGSGSEHLKFIPQRTSVHIQWTGFEDPQSEIKHYEYCIGSKPYICDICPLSSGLLQSHIIKTGLNLPVGLKLYAMVKAFNWAGMSANQTTDSFQVDLTPPQILNEPKFHSMGYNQFSWNKNVQWDKSLLRISWKFTDTDSPITKHIITLKTHHDGHTPIENVVIGNTNSFLINLDEANWLHDGDNYYVDVTGCNLAGLCSSSESKSLLIDSSPPHMGGLMSPMNWTNFLDPFNITRANISISWYGFIDPDSAVNTYYITVSKHYSGDELTNGIVLINEDDFNAKHSAVVTLNESLTDGYPIIITIFAQNAAGINSTHYRVTVLPLSFSSKWANVEHQSGLLELEKHSCKIHSCNQDCTCSIIGKYCTLSQMLNCVQVNTTSIGTLNYPKVLVHGGLGNSSENITVSSACLSGHWATIGSNDAFVVRYEWSMGLSGQKAGDGIFSTSEKQWHDIGKGNNVIHCLPLGSGLTHGMQYTVYVKAWYSATEYFTFTSSPITVDHTPPQQAKGRSIVDSNSNCVVDYDVIDWMDELTFCWKGVFRETQSNLAYFAVALGTSVNGSDVYPTTTVGLETNVTLANMSLSHGTRYFFTVTAYNTLWMHTTLSSDGFVIDMDTPVAGVVFNTDRYTDKRFQSSTSTFGISWHGFHDQHSGVRSYYTALSEEKSLDFSIIKFRNVCLKTSYAFTNLALEHGKAYFGLVKACDAAGHCSDIAKSTVKYVDVTPPHGLHCDRYTFMQRNKTDQDQPRTKFSNVYLQLTADLKKDNLYKVSGTTHSNGAISKFVLVMDRFEVALHTSHNYDGSEYYEYNFISQETKSMVIEIKQIFVTVVRHYSLLANLYECIHSSAKRNSDSAITLQQIGPSTVAVTAILLDPESSIYKVRYGIGTTSGGLQIRPFTLLNERSQAVIDINVDHGSMLYLTVLAENHAGLTSNFSSNPIRFDKTPPVINNLNATSVAIGDVSNETSTVYSIFAKWKIEDDESGVKACYCGLGTGFQMKGIDKLKLAETNETCHFENMTFWHGENVVFKALCINNVDLPQEVVSYPIIVSKYHPRNEFAKLHVVSAVQNKQEIVLFGKRIIDLYVQPDKSHVQIEWSGFEDISGIDHYEYRLRHNSSHEADWKSANKETFVEVTGLHLVPNELYFVDVRAINAGYFISETVTANLLVDEDHPKLSGKPMTISIHNRTIEVDWTDVFDIPAFEGLLYDVTVGSRRGYSDVKQLQSVKFQYFTFSIPESTTVSSKITEIFIFVTGIYSSGLSKQYEMNFKM